MSAAVIVLLGPPGSGKGTQAKELAAKNTGWVHVSTGDLFRKEIHSGSQLGNSVKDILAAGRLVPDETTNSVFQSQVKALLAEKNPAVLLLDGYPRTGPQAQSLMAFYGGDKRLSVPRVIELAVSLDNVVFRLGGRLVNPRTGRVYHKVLNPPKKPGICDEDGGPLIQRDDDKEETIRKRYAIYTSERDSIVKGLGGQVVSVNGEGELPQVTARLSEAIRKLLN